MSGATDRAVFARLLSEGMLLLLIVTVPALLIDFNLAKAEVNAWRNGTTLEWDRLLLCAGAAFVLTGLRPHRPDDCHRHLVSGPSGDAHTTRRGVARRIGELRPLFPKSFILHA